MEGNWNGYMYQVSRHSMELLARLNGQRKAGRLCDVVVKVGEQSFPAHKAVLAACSDYFDSLFSADAEGSLRELEMHTISAKVFRDILDFAYTAKIVVRLDNFPELMTAAKFLVMKSVVEICQEVIKQSQIPLPLALARTRDAGHGHPAYRSVDFGYDLDMELGANTEGENGGVTMTSGELNKLVTPGGLGQPQDSVSQQTGPLLPMMDSAETKRVQSEPIKTEPGVSMTSGTGTSAPTVTVPGTERKEKSRGPYVCSYCGKEFRDSYHLRRHETRHTGVKMPTATRTKKEQPQMSAMIPVSTNGASQGVGVGQPIPGPSPGAGSGGAGVGTNTVNTPCKPPPKKNHPCDVCGKAFRDIYHLNRHKLSHSDEKPFECPVCQQRFKRKDRMAFHVRSHEGNVAKPYVCDSCGKGFSRPDHLSNHVRQVHSTERPFKCQTCEAAFATKDRLRSHMGRHEEKVACHVCGKQLGASQLPEHMKAHAEQPSHVCNISKDLCCVGHLTGQISAQIPAPIPTPGPAYFPMY
uniref:Myc-associated zinc finger protein n=1 Tax=Eptatretus burgeri TaxID=7764 RepID=A0A8C4QXE7_EPTBU